MIRISAEKPRFWGILRPGITNPEPAVREPKYVRQKSGTDCGQTCLDMLGYDGHAMFPQRKEVGLMGLDFAKLPGARLVHIPKGKEEPLDYSYPHIWSITQACGIGHFLIRYKDKVYCPTLGILDVPIYMNQVDIASIDRVIIVPFKGEQIPERYLSLETYREKDQKQEFNPRPIFIG